MVNIPKNDLHDQNVVEKNPQIISKSEEELGKESEAIAEISEEKEDNKKNQGVEADVLKNKLGEDKIHDLEKAGYLSDLDGKKISSLDVVEYDKETIFEKLESQKLPAGVVKHLNYTTPKAQKLKIVMIRVDREQNDKLNPAEQITESNFIAKMKEFGVRPIKFEEYLQFISNNSEYLKDKKGYIYMLESVVSSERYYGRIQSHYNGIGIDMSQGIFYAKFPFVIEE